MPKPTIFISHSHFDNEWCRQFVAALQQLGYDVWYDEKGLSSGAQWVRTIERELEGRKIFAIILTPQSWESDWVQQELQLALTTRRRIIPVLLKQTAVTGFVRTYQQIDAMKTQVDAVASAFDIAVSLSLASTRLDPIDSETHEVVKAEPGTSQLPGHTSDGQQLIRKIIDDVGVANEPWPPAPQLFPAGKAERVGHGAKSHLPEHHNQAAPTKRPWLIGIEEMDVGKECDLYTHNWIVYSPTEPSRLDIQRDNFTAEGPTGLRTAAYIRWNEPNLLIQPSVPWVLVNDKTIPRETATTLSHGDTISIPITDTSKRTTWISLRFEYR